MKKSNWGIKILKWIGIIFIVPIIIGILGFPPLFLKLLSGHKDVKEMDSLDIGLKSSEVILKTEDKLDIQSWEVTTENEPKGIVIFLSGIENPSVTAYFPHAKFLKEEGYGSLLIEMRGHGRSQGGDIYYGYEEPKDVKAGIDYIKSKDKYKDTPIIMFGTSMGGSVAINATANYDEIDGLISLSAYSSPEDIILDQFLDNGTPEFLANLEKKLFRLSLKSKFGKENIKNTPINNIKKLNNRPTLLMHSKNDSQVPFSSFERLINNADSHIDTYVVDGDYHFIFNTENFEDVDQDRGYVDTILNFLQDNFE